MSKETRNAMPCWCGQRFAFPEYHLPHCKSRQTAAKKPQPIVPVGVGTVKDKPVSKKFGAKDKKKRGAGR